MTGLVNQELLLRNEYLTAENRVLRAHLPTRLRLSDAERSTLAEIAANPGAGNILVGTIRRRFVQRFPFAILYQSGPESLSVIAVMHLRRRPGYWKRRLKAKS